ncbi:hypothetical protein J2S74_005232 [Evansella vedderi]|uniref:DUF4352 domain-containing protein n=1 Tax=Evansella vedderi TaxID=38282 RepID=A0ABU0A601_9BACI|nr:DUF4352 domain-containing protein [Evansella vedderi]MDQ0257770.1 hypothetical protein [Evansella vedderi]
MKKYFFSLITLLLFVGLVTACGESTIEPVDNEPEESEEAATQTPETEEDATTEEEDATTEEEEATEEIIEEDLSVGDTINFNGLHITLNGVRTSEGEEFFEPDRDFFFILDMTIDNTTDEAAHVSTMLQMTLVDPDGYSQDMDFFADTRGSLDGEVGPGRKMAGEISFDVEDADYFEFLFEDPFMTGQAIWKINRADWE